MFLSFSSLLAALADGTEEGTVRMASLAVGLSIVPFVFIILAFGTRHPRAPGAVLRALGVWVLVSVAAGWFSFALGLALAFGLGGMLAVRSDELGAQRIRALWLGAAIVYVVILAALLSTAVGLFAAGTVPLLAIGLADHYTEMRARGAAQA